MYHLPSKFHDDDDNDDDDSDDSGFPLSTALLPYGL